MAVLEISRADSWVADTPDERKRASGASKENRQLPLVPKRWKRLVLEARGPWNPSGQGVLSASSFINLEHPNVATLGGRTGLAPGEEALCRLGGWPSSSQPIGFHTASRPRLTQGRQVRAA